MVFIASLYNQRYVISPVQLYRRMSMVCLQKDAQETVMQMKHEHPGDEYEHDRYRRLDTPAPLERLDEDAILS